MSPKQRKERLGTRTVIAAVVRKIDHLLNIPQVSFTDPRAHPVRAIKSRREKLQVPLMVITVRY
jgi:hypothetical protein